LTGPQGFQGNQGFQGRTGSNGATGSQGPTGPQGFQGNQGFQGPTGPQGFQGNQGNQGPTGPQGFQGSVGPQGYGATGFQGNQGNQGPTGPQGTTGPQGSGAQGPQGPTGFQGNQGSVGPQGTTGPQGFQGVTGPSADLSVSNYVSQGILSANQPFTASDVLIAFVSDFDPQNWWNASTKQFLPTIAGYYEITLNGWWSGTYSVNNQHNLQARKNGGTFLISQAQITSATFSGFSSGGTKLIYLNGTTDYVDFTAYTGVPQTLLKGSTLGSGTWFSAVLITNGQGAQGTTGSQGVQGNQGPTGPQGFQGSGVTGPQGFQGNQGFQGPTGPQGFQGNQGFQGRTGSNGATGSQGPTGPQGFQGNQGFQGPTGPQGFQGNQGSQGPTGPQGFQGNQGNQGPTGPQGFQGNQGFQGPTGPQGFQGNQGNQGPTGPQGFQGNQGNQGPTGPQGFQGNQGFQGPTGPQGNQGPTGPQGFQGNQGNQGPTGPQGNQGFQGNQGPTGPNSLTVGSTSILSGTVGYVLFQGSGNVLQQSSQFYWDQTNNRLGLGITAPSYQLHALSTSGVDSVMFFDGGTLANANLVTRADTTTKVPFIVLSDRNDAYNINNSFYISLDRATGPSWNNLFANRNDAIYVNNYQNKSHHFVTNNGGSKGIRLTISGDGKVGIGTASPTASLEIQNNSTSSGLIVSGSSSTDMVRITQLGDGNAILVEDSTNPDSSPFLVAADGKVYIGITTSSTSVLNVSGNTLLYGNIFINGTSNRSIQNSVAGRALINFATVGDSYFNNGNLGIGTITPGSKLDIDASTGSTIGLRVSGETSTDLVRITQTGSGNALIVEDSSNPDSSPFVVDSVGSVGIGMTAPSFNLDVVGRQRITGTGSTYSLEVTSTGNSFIVMYGNGVSSTDGYVRFTNGVQTANIFAPTIWSRSNTNGYPSTWILSDLLTGTDIGTTSITRFESRLNGSSLVTTRPLFEWRNSTTTNMLMFVDGSLMLQNGGTFLGVTSSILTLNSTTKGFLPPRMLSSEKNAIVSATAGLLVFDTNLSLYSFYNGTTWSSINTVNNGTTNQIAFYSGTSAISSTSSITFTTNMVNINSPITITSSSGGALVTLTGNNANGGWINMTNFGGSAPPTFTTRSIGSKIVLYETIGTASAGYAFGVAPSTLWYGVDTQGSSHKWYAGTTLVSTLDGYGNYSVIGGLLSTSTYSSSFTNGIVTDFITGNGRISVGSNTNISLYTGGIGSTTMSTFGTNSILLFQPTTISSNLNVSGNSILTGNVFSGTQSVLGNISATGSLTITGNSNLRGTLSSGTQSILGNISATGSLSVTNNATITNTLTAGTISVINLASATTFNAATYQIATFKALDGPAFSAYGSVATTLNNNVVTKITLDTEEFDSDNAFSTSTYRFTPTLAGYYLFHGHISVVTYASNAGSQIMSLYKNGYEFKRGVRVPCNTNGVGTMISAMIFMDGITDYIEMYGLQGSGGNVTTETGQQFGPYLQGNFVKPPIYSYVSVQYLVIGGGGGGGCNWGGGGGGGAFVEGTSGFAKGFVYDVIVGTGGAGATTTGAGGNGGTSYIQGVKYTSSNFTITGSGGGGGGFNSSGSTAVVGNSNGNGSGGGAGFPGSGGTVAGGSGVNNVTIEFQTINSYNSGGQSRGLSTFGCGGGGGAGAVGTEGQTSQAGGDGGAGKTSSITGTSSYYSAGGGGGGGNGSVQSSGGTGNTGGKGGNTTGGAGTNGAGGYGMGGGGGATNTGQGGNGSNGVVILRVLTSQNSTVIGTYTTSTDGLYTIFTITGDSQFIP
jgi:hypothetical protein